jgi:Ca2+-binding EF-hand superfamily protein
MFKRTLIAAALISAAQIVPALALAAQDRPAGATRSPAGEQFRKADTDGNGMLSRAEAQKGAPRLARHFEAIDANRDGQIGPEEIRAWHRSTKVQRRTRSDNARAKFDQHFAKADADGDGALTRAEAEKGMPRVAKKFERIDADHDGRITRDELRAWLQAKQAARTGKS